MQKDREYSNVKPDVLRIAILTGFTVLIALTLWAIYFFIKNDGTESLAGAQKILGTKAVEDQQYLVDNKIRWSYRTHVNWIRPTSQEEAARYCNEQSPTSNDPNNPRHYTVAVTTEQLFGMDAKTVIIEGCQAFGAAEGSRGYIVR